MRPALVGLAFASACSRTPPTIASCADSVEGVWRGPDGEWHVLDRGVSVEAYPLFPDAKPAPRVLDLRRASTLTGEIRRRYMQGDQVCIATVSVRVLACSTHILELTLADPSPPLSYTPCAFSTRTNPSRKETWTRAF